MLVATFGLASLVAASQVAYDVLRIAGAVVLILLGLQPLLRARRPPRPRHPPRRRTKLTSTR